MIEITPVLDNKNGKPLYIQLANYIKQEILSGRIKPKEKLPSKRNLSNYLGLSLNTIQSAYEQLCAEGYIESKPRKGLFVTTFDNDIIFNQRDFEKLESKSKQVQVNAKIDFNSGKVDLEHFPYAIWRKLTIQSLYEDQGELFYNGNPQGELLLREQIAAYLFASRGVRCSAEQIIIGAGTQVLIGLLCMLIGKEHIYALENPGFHRTRMTLQDLGVHTVSIPLDEDGININQLKNTNANVVYVTPSHQFPYGMIMPISRRMDLLKWAEEKNGYIIEDDYDGEYRYKGKPIPSLQGLDTKENVVYLGTFSKSLIPSIRISYMVLPSSLMKKYQEHFTIYKQTVSRLHQDTLYRFMENGLWQSHLNKMRTLYRKKHSTLMLAVKNYLGEKVNIIGEKSGLHIVLEVKNSMEEDELINTAMNVGVKVYPLSIYYNGTIGSLGCRILLGFGGVSETEINTGIRLLKEAWKL
ncbi:MocR-like pyridoxine biosynthesis transcription factor PdxR [Aneurinibacillus migulanus]|uniref:GntR family transcriptional regulator n=1 Tax=Aneurinibacillus migulanus TaxID=47500 RepID=A0A0D1VCL9_ANEMI|nr:PLP-dependent aminotransferase family protein [Aneurinibacillus migulanus]KIV57184.1 GntR family transcriptional regulator [Aneurinibacillus migulanus]KON96923.1 GntR family transcriptional regulator [Aneurinibacillus migulanus]MED0894283.1 PLP-dependent aminotransferase family protein [Aneurinibacillus migulanus]MED1619556.1 PLP-dependent aminotransferase family protein [Aneurinibacillus migulanus]SDJ68733.1 GntR family transcriptional regulator / MocR family aminotransferase [Aneurinibaci